MQKTVERIEDGLWAIFRVVKIIILTIVLIIIGIIGLFKYHQDNQADRWCEQEMGPGWSAITAPGDTYGALCENGTQTRWSRPKGFIQN